VANNSLGLVSGNIPVKFVRIFAPFSKEVALNNSAVMGLRNLKKLGQHYYIVLFSRRLVIDSKTRDLE